MVANAEGITKINRALISVVGFWCFSLTLPSALAAPPVAFGNWGQASNGAVSASCPAGFKCEVSVVGAGILQRILTASNGNRYIQMILTDGSGTASTTSLESFVKADNAATSVPGISARQTLVQTGAANTINSNTEINTGWANTAGAPAVKISQVMGSTAVPGLGFATAFDLSVNQNAAGQSTGYFMGIRQEVVGAAIAMGTGLSTGGDKQTFVIRQAGGNMVSAGTAVLPPSAGGMMMGGGGAAGGGGMGGGMGGGAAAPAPAAPAAPATPVAGAPVVTPVTPVVTPITPAPVAAAPAPVAAAPAAGGMGGGMGGMSRSNTLATTGSGVSSNGNANRVTVTTAALTTNATTPLPPMPPQPTLATPITQVVYAPGRVGQVSITNTVNDGNPPPNPYQPDLASVTITPLRPGPPVPVVVGAISPVSASPQGPVPNIGGMGGGGMGGGGGPGGGTLSWGAGAEVQAMYIGQNCPGCDAAFQGGMGGGGGGMMGTATPGIFSYEQYTDLSNTATAIITRSIMTNAAANWSNANIFGAAPNF
ncbi:MAG: hypothetical protein OEW08_04595 [Gammaproteobacteria bacterium]|nr:hypothetical protein [Gammaproteobacteria bacterium]